MVPSCDAGKGVCHEGKGKGTKLYVLTTSGTKIETAAKRRFLDRYYAGMFDDIYAVEHDDDKVRFILKKQQSLGLNRRTVSLWRIHTAYFCRQ